MRYGFRIEAADADDGNIDGIAYRPQLVKRDVDGIGLGRRGDERPDAEVIGASSLRLERLGDRLGRNADYRIRPQHLARLGAREIVLADMHAVSSDFKCSLDVVVNDERHSRRTANRQELLPKRDELFARCVLLAQLHKRHTTFDGLTHAIGELPASQPCAIGHCIKPHGVFERAHLTPPRYDQQLQAPGHSCCRAHR